MRNRRTIALIAAAAATLAAGTAITLGAGGSPSGPGAGTAGPDPLSAAAEPVAAPSSAVAARAATRSGKVSVAYFESKAIDLGNGSAGSGNLYFKFKGNACPKGSKAIDGYMFYAGKELPPAYVVPAGDAPRGLRNWQFWLNNPNDPTVDEGVKFGIICAKHVG